MTTIRRADTAGFCIKKKKKKKKLDKLVEADKGSSRIYTFGPIIHNPQVLNRYAQKGVLQASALTDIQEPGQVIIRAHGIPLSEQKKLESMQLKIVDATCPKVKKAQLLIAEQTQRKRHLLLFGEPEHPEVQGLLSYSDSKALVFSSLDELQKLQLDHSEAYFLAAQTTQNRKEFREILNYLQTNLDPEIPVCDTICDTTRKRQEEALQIAREVDIMVVVGGYTSGNTRRLVQVVREQNVPAIHVEEALELAVDDLKDKHKIGLTAGASTPKDIIDAVQEKIESMLKA